MKRRLLVELSDGESAMFASAVGELRRIGITEAEMSDERFASLIVASFVTAASANPLKFTHAMLSKLPRDLTV